MNFSEKLEHFADLAAGQEFEEEYLYWDIGDSEYLEEAEDYFREELGFLSGQDRRELMDIWKKVCEDERNLKLLFNTIKVLQSKYGEVLKNA